MRTPNILSPLGLPEEAPLTQTWGSNPCLVNALLVSSNVTTKALQGPIQKIMELLG